MGYRKCTESGVWWLKFVILALGRLGQEGHTVQFQPGSQMVTVPLKMVTHRKICKEASKT